ncbi:hypothetical protein F3Y22_tig00117005pilonHSYRG00026 [Hibiscus syriacus]|uniref:GBF-interacting protein 1 N-terminal domain-containing protein n=1 Tax=Hibiscus syriacus TaxID=106335 RepID=A0A6A2XIB6_HIBSY|nr:uncharacterized protein LOC120194926 [Hibiscus syriacus]KAE8656167.1 hypothetical protein F3Y22_tig00117005pilonHSYRG00026 [Hibiscus syriacus]
MSGKGGGGNNGLGKGSSGISGIPAGSRNMVQSLKEIVNCPEPEIYSMLKECNMDPNEAVNRLLSQDPFYEVKSKRDKKKSKDTIDSRFRGANNIESRVGRSGSDRYIGRGGSSNYSSNEPGLFNGKPAQKRENGTHAYADSSSSASGLQGNNMNQRPPPHGEAVVTEHKTSTAGLVGVSLLSQHSGYQSAWLGAPGQVSMADIVKMGRPQNKVSVIPNPPHQSVNNRDIAVHPNIHPPHGHISKVSDVTYEPNVTTSQHSSPSDEWPPIDNPSTVCGNAEASAESGLYADASKLPVDRNNQHIEAKLEEAETGDDGPVETVYDNNVQPPSISSRNIQEDNSGGSSLYDNNLRTDTSSYQPQKHAFENNEAEDDSSSVDVNMQKLNLHNDEQEPPHEEDNPSVIIPNHLQVHSLDCSHLSFGSFGPGIGSESFSSPLQNNLDEAPESADISSIGDNEDRNPEYYGDELLRSNTDENIMSRSNVSTGNYEATEFSQPTELKQDASVAAQGSQYAFPSSASGYNYENSQQLNPAFTHPQTNTQIHNLTPFSSVMQAYTNSLSSTLQTSTVQTAGEPDLPYLPFPVTTKYTNAVSSISGPTISMPEAQRAASISTPHETPHTPPGASVASGPALPQHLAMHPFSQPTLPLGHFANMISYPFLPQSYTYMPPAFQQTFAGNSNYPQSLAALLPQYKNSVSVSSLPQSAAIVSGYGLGNSTNVPGGLPLNPPTAPAGTTIGYDDILSSQYKENNHLMSLKQTENSAMWVHGGPGSRTMSAVPGSTYYSFQGQNLQGSGFRQGQQPSQQFGSLGYPNFYHSQTGVLGDHQQQNPMDGTPSGSQGQPSKQTQQYWQNSY